MKPLITKAQKARQDKHKKIRKMYADLTVIQGLSATAAEVKVMNKFGVKSRTTIWCIVHKNQRKVDRGESG